MDRVGMSSGLLSGLSNALIELRRVVQVPPRPDDAESGQRLAGARRRTQVLSL